MRTSIETVSGNDVRIFAMCIIETAEEPCLDIECGQLQRIADAAQLVGRMTCPASCEMKVSAAKTGDGMHHEIDIDCRAEASKCAGGNFSAVCNAFDAVVEQTGALGIFDIPIDDWSNLQSRRDV